MPSIWSYSDYSDRGYGLFKRRIFREMEKLGWTTILAEASLDDPEAKPFLREHLFSHPSDWILLINQSTAQLAQYLSVPPGRTPLPGKKLIWYLDDPRFFIDRPFQQEEYVFSFDETYIDCIRRFNPTHCGFWPLAADCEEPGRYDPTLACQICFVGGLIDQSERRAQLSPDLLAYVEHLVELQFQHRDKSFYQLAEEYPYAPGKMITITPQVAHYLYWEANNRYRIRTLEALMDFDLRIYGNEDWEKLLSGSPLLECFCGPADPVKELPHIFASANINLNIHSIQCRGSLNQRDFNAPVAGGFLLSDWVPAAGKYFQPGVEAVYWNDVENLRAKIAYYLDHPAECRSAVERGRRRVLKDHTYKQRVRQLLQTLQLY